MRKTLFIFLTVLLMALSVFAQTYVVPPSKHVVMVALENTAYSKVTNNTMPYVYSLAQRNGIATAFYATTHPSIGNYFSATLGQIITNSDGSQTTRTEDNIVRHMISSGLTWKSYAENLPYVGYTGGDKYPYVLHHNPFAYFSDVRNSSAEKLNLVPFTQWQTDINNDSLPNFSFIVPNMHHNAHDCPDGMTTCTQTDKLISADRWIKNYIAQVQALPAFQPGGDGLLIIWFDESSSSDTAYGGGHIFVAVIGPNVRPAHLGGTHYNHYGLLKTIMESLGMKTFPAKAATATDMKSMFNAMNTPPPPTATETVTITSPGATATGPSVRVTASADSAQSIQYTQIWLDGVKVFEATGPAVDQLVNMADGSRRIVVQSKRADGTIIKAVEYVTVSSVAAQHSVDLSWNASTSSGVTGYNVYRGTQSGTYALLQGPVTGTSFTDPNVTSGATYYYALTSVAGSAESAFSSEAKAVIP